MGNRRFVIGIVLLVLAALSFALGLAHVSLRIGATEVNAYVAVVLALLGVRLILRPNDETSPRRRDPG